MESIIIQSAGIITSILAVFIIFSKNINHILAGEIAINLILAVIYGTLDGLSAAGISIIATVQGIVFYLYQKKDKKVPIWVILLFLAIYGVWLILTYSGIADLFPAFCVLFYALAVMQKKPSNYRILKLFNAGFWIIYDIAMLAFGALLTHGIVLAASVIAIIKLDFRKK